MVPGRALSKNRHATADNENMNPLRNTIEEVRALIEANGHHLPAQLTSAELFAGYGGLAQAIERAFGAHTLWLSEFDAAPSKILAHHWPDVINHGDVTKINWALMGRPNIMGGGFPCQDVSLAGLRMGLNADTRSGLWFHFLKGIVALQPEFVLFENVRGILSAKSVRDAPSTPETLAIDAELLELTTRSETLHAELDHLYDAASHAEFNAVEDRISGLLEQRERAMGDEPDGPIQRALGTVLGDLADAGYDAQWCGLRAADVGAPHGRFRVFGLGIRRDLLSPAA
ncbi:DNA methylase [Arthrobacter phage PrincessTrina]|uniref:DNA (cytosine-5-)-methyltransferase n=1 Tax=Arthrobacter phage PrincessTrina TaxID=1772328 RepID=A0A0U4JD58_9CAUD|nr:DNA methyltransferase [Arthrobacter phage PrincessTrina]ALY09925.1 DNA methylase [Arthrobacter phage PrincessTrina]